MLQLLNIGTHTGGEHQYNDTQLTELGQELRLCQNIQHGRTQDQSGQQRAHHLGHLETAGHDAQHLGAEQDQRQVQQIMIRHGTHLFLPVTTGFTIIYLLCEPLL